MIRPRVTTLDSGLIEAFRTVPTAHASDCLGRTIGAFGLMAYHGSLGPGLCGPALTVRVRPGDNPMLHQAILMAEPGDVIVMEGGGDLTHALLGGLLRTPALARGIGGDRKST